MSIELRDVHKAFGPKKILRGLSLAVEEGERSWSRLVPTLRLVLGLCDVDHP